MLQRPTESNNIVRRDGNRLVIGDPNTVTYMDAQRLKTEIESTLRHGQQINRICIAGEVRLSGDASYLFAPPLFAYSALGDSTMRVKEIEGLQRIDTSLVNDMSGMFSGMRSLGSVKGIENWDTHNVRSMRAMFADCRKLTDIDVSGFDTSSVTDTSDMFDRCHSVKSLNLSNFDMSNVTNISGMCTDCTQLEDVSIAGWNAPRLEAMNDMFCRCRSLRKLDTAGISLNGDLMVGMFYGCQSIETLDLSGITGTAQDSAIAFAKCSSLRTVDLSNLNAKLKAGTERMFDDCDSLETVKITDTMRNELSRRESLPEAARATRTPMVDINENGTMFIHGKCDVMPACDLREMIRAAILNNENDPRHYGPREIHIIDPIDLGESAEGLFANMPQLHTISGLNNLKLNRVTNMKGMFRGDERLSQMYGDTKCTMDDPYMSPENPNKESLPASISLRNASHLKDVSHMFEGCTSLESVHIEGDKRSPVENMEGMFESCRSLKRIDINGVDASHVGHMSRMFAGCRRLKSIDAQNTILPPVKSIYVQTIDHRDMFEGCVSLNEVHASPSMRTLLALHGLTNDVLAARRENMATVARQENGALIIGKPERDYAIDASVLADVITEIEGTNGRSNIHEVLIAGNVSLKGDATDLFFGHLNVKAIKGLDLLDTSQVTNMSGMFSQCRNLRTIDIGCLDTSNVTNMSRMFFGCASLEGVRLDGIDTSHVTSTQSMFGSCGTLQSLDVSPLDMSSVEDTSGMFEYCKSLKKLDISSWRAPNLTDMKYMFGACDNLSELKTDGMSAGTIDRPKETDGMFAFCEKLSSLNLSGFGITEHDLKPSTFTGCELPQAKVVLEEQHEPPKVVRTPIAVEFDDAGTFGMSYQLN